MCYKRCDKVVNMLLTIQITRDVTKALCCNKLHCRTFCCACVPRLQQRSVNAATVLCRAVV